MPSTQIAQAGVFGLIANSGLMAKFVLIVLAGASVLCWAIIVTKWRSFRRAMDENARFLTLFWHGQNLEEIYASSDKILSSPVANVFKAGIREFKKVSTGDLTTATSEKVENIGRALNRTAYSEVASLEKHLGWLATTASAAPFVGLFGTVWGIMNSFQSIGATGAANLAVVAPGISEALITTATGIGAAIPAVIAYNHFVGQIKRVNVDMDCFIQDFLNIIQRSVLSNRKGG